MVVLSTKTPWDLKLVFLLHLRKEYKVYQAEPLRASWPWGKKPANQKVLRIDNIQQWDKLFAFTSGCCLLETALPIRAKLSRAARAVSKKISCWINNLVEDSRWELNFFPFNCISSSQKKPQTKCGKTYQKYSSTLIWVCFIYLVSLIHPGLIIFNTVTVNNNFCETAAAGVLAS